MYNRYSFGILLTIVFGLPIQPPNNIICFVERDFCTLENFIDKTGQSLLVEVVHAGAVVGSATGTVSGDAVAFEINHPGGRCWGDGTAIKVTPDIQPGDLVTVKSGALLLGDMTIADGHIKTYSLSGNILTIVGYVGSTVNPGNLEVRIVNPLLLDTVVDKRQVSAASGPVVQNVGYSSGVQVVGTTFTATFTFASQQAADIAGSGEGYSVSIWQETGPNGARQAVTVSEYGEVGGPFSNLCPPGPENLGSPAAQAIGISGNIIKWAPGKEVIRAPPTTGYSVSVLRGNQVYGYRVANTDTQVVFDLTPLAGGDVIEVRSLLGTKMSDPYVVTYQPQDVVPTILTVPANNGVTEVQTELVILDSNTNQIAYTVDGSPVVGVDGKISRTAMLYYAPIHVTQAFTLRAVSFDVSGKISSELVAKFAPAVNLPQAVTTAPVARVENGGVTLSWVKPADPTISGFGVDVFTPAGEKVGVTRVIVGTTVAIKDLVPGASYQFSVTSQSVGGVSQPSPKTAVIIFPFPTDIISITGARYTANKQFRITGTGNVAATATLYATNADGTIGAVIFNRGTTTPISAPIVCGVAGGACTFSMDVRNGAVPVTNPGRIYVKSSRGGVSGPFVVA